MTQCCVHVSLSQVVLFGMVSIREPTYDSSKFLLRNISDIRSDIAENVELIKSAGPLSTGISVIGR